MTRLSYHLTPDRISDNVGNNIAELIHADENTVEQEKIAFIQGMIKGLPLDEKRPFNVTQFKTPDNWPKY